LLTTKKCEMCCSRASKTAVSAFGQEKQHHTLYYFEKNDVIHKKQVKILKITPTQLEKIPRCCRFLLRKHFSDQKVIVMHDEKFLHCHTASP
jgi:hypothetical protein